MRALTIQSRILRARRESAAARSALGAVQGQESDKSLAPVPAAAVTVVDEQAQGAISEPVSPPVVKKVAVKKTGAVKPAVKTAARKPRANNSKTTK